MGPHTRRARTHTWARARARTLCVGVGPYRAGRACARARVGLAHVEPDIDAHEVLF
jgi:hypothetical protein